MMKKPEDPDSGLAKLLKPNQKISNNYDFQFEKLKRQYGPTIINSSSPTSTTQQGHSIARQNQQSRPKTGNQFGVTFSRHKYFKLNSKFIDY